MSNQHPITPPTELVDKWYDEWLNADDLTHLDTRVAILAARWGADQELEACCEWLRKDSDANELVGLHAVYLDHNLRAARRPKPPTLKEQALAGFERVLSQLYSPEARKGLEAECKTIRRAIEALPND